MSLTQGPVVVDETSNDVEAVEYIDNQDEGDSDNAEKRPIMLLLHRLIRNKYQTVMTNAQIIDILQSELNICVQSCHELEVDIYVKIIKKYLRDWPQWEELEHMSIKLSNIKDYGAISNLLNLKYKNLKEYLGVMIEAAKPLAKDAVKALPPKKVEMDEMDEISDSSDVVMEVECTKEQLNDLFFRRPRLDLNETIFNVSTIPPSPIARKRLSFGQILNGWCININVTLLHFIFAREVKYKLKHVLVNKVRNENFTDKILETKLQTLRREQKTKNAKYSRDTIFKQFRDVLAECFAQKNELYTEVQALFDFLLFELKDTFQKDVYYKIPANYRRYANKHKYVRYFCVENDQSEDSRYDLQLEETVAPMYCYYFDKLCRNEELIKNNNHVGGSISGWIKIYCVFCKTNLSINTSIKEAVESHFNNVHQNEKDWQCTHCKKSFDIEYLSNNKWLHEC